MTRKSYSRGKFKENERMFLRLIIQTSKHLMEWLVQKVLLLLKYDFSRFSCLSMKNIAFLIIDGLVLHFPQSTFVIICNEYLVNVFRILYISPGPKPRTILRPCSFQWNPFRVSRLRLSDFTMQYIKGGEGNC